MALKTYRELKPDGRYLKRVGVEAGASLDESDFREAQHEAATLIDAHLVTTFTQSDVPPIIRSLADLLGSAMVLEWIAEGGSDSALVERAQRYRERAFDLMDKMRAHEMGVQNSDGTYHASYPAPDVLGGIEVGGPKPVTMHEGLDWGEMARPKMTNDEKRALLGDASERQRESDDMVAAFAGAYDL